MLHAIEKNKNIFKSNESCHRMVDLQEIMSKKAIYRLYKKCPKWKISSTSDIPQNQSIRCNFLFYRNQAKCLWHEHYYGLIEKSF